MSISHFKISPTFTVSAEQVEMRANLDVLISTFDEKMKGQLLNIFNETVNQIVTSRYCQMIELAELDVVLMRYPDKYSSVICKLIEELLFMKRDQINQDEKILNILLDHGKRPETDFGKWLSFFPSPVPSMDFNQYFGRDFPGYLEQGFTETTLALSSSEHEESIINYANDHDVEVPLQVELNDDTREKKPFIDQLFDTLTKDPRRLNLIKNITDSKPKKRSSKKTSKTPGLILNSKAEPSGKITVCKSPDHLFNTLHAMIGIKDKKEKNKEVPSFEYLDCQEGIEFLKAWIDKSSGSINEHPHLLLISIYIFNQVILLNKNNAEINNLFEKIKSSFGENKKIDTNLKNSFVKYYNSIVTHSPSSSPKLQEDPLIKQLLLSTDLRTQGKIANIHLTESSIYTIKSTITYLIKTNSIESLGKALIIYNLHSKWLNEDKEYDSCSNILGGIFTLLFNSKKPQTDIENLIKQCGENKKLIFDELNELLKEAKKSTDIRQKNNICYISALFLYTGLDSKKIFNERLNLILQWMEVVNLNNIDISESNYKDFLDTNLICFEFAKNNSILFQGNTKSNLFSDFLQNSKNLTEKIRAFQRLHPELVEIYKSSSE